MLFPTKNRAHFWGELCFIILLSNEYTKDYVREFFEFSLYLHFYSFYATINSIFSGGSDKMLPMIYMALVDDDDLPQFEELYEKYRQEAYYSAFNILHNEALVNALIHRDYLVNGSEVYVDIFDDRMEIYSPGGMPDGTMIQDRNIEQIPSTRRNPVLADIFARLGYMEREGSGIKKIRMSSFSSPNFTPDKEPQFYSDRVQFVVTFPNLNYGHKTVQVMDQDTDQVIGSVTLAALVAYCKTSRSRREIQEYCGLSGRPNFRIKYLKP